MTDFEKARLKYRPELIRYLIIAETPPKTESKRFFYFEDVQNQDSLFIEMIKCLYHIDTRDLNAKSIRAKKADFLRKFQGDGFYLIDSLDSPFEKNYSSAKKVALIKNGQNELL